MTGNTTYGNLKEGKIVGKVASKEQETSNTGDKQYLIAGHACLARSISLHFYFLPLSNKHLILVEDGRLDYNGRVRHARFEVLFSCKL